MGETMLEKLQWVIDLLRKIVKGGMLRFDVGGGNWRVVDWWSCDWEYDEARYRVLPAWAWELVDAEKNGAVIEYNFATSDCSEPEWVIRATVEMEHDNTQGEAGKAWWRIKPDPEPVTEVLIKEITAVDFSALLDVLKTIGDRLDRLETRLIG